MVQLLTGKRYEEEKLARLLAAGIAFHVRPFPGLRNRRRATRFHPVAGGHDRVDSRETTFEAGPFPCSRTLRGKAALSERKGGFSVFSCAPTSSQETEMNASSISPFCSRGPRGLQSLRVLSTSRRSLGRTWDFEKTSGD